MSWWVTGFNFLAGVSGISSVSGWLRERRRSSPAYKVAEDKQNMVQDRPVPIVYGKARVKGHVIYREDTYDKIYDFAVGLCEGEINSIDNVRIEGRAIEDIGDSSYTTYTGTSSQAGDDIFKSGVIVMPCVEDAFIDDANKDTNYNTEYLMVRYSSPERRIYLKFSLNDMPSDITITSAEIRLRQHFVTAKHNIKGYNVGSEDWDESTLTWNNAPSTETQYLSDSDITPGGDYEAIFFNSAGLKALKAAYNASQSTFSVDIRASESLDYQFKSKESEYVSPQLIITFTGATPVGFRNTSYIAMSVDNGADQINARYPEVTAEVEGLKISAYDGDSWGSASYSNNPAWIVYDFLTNGRYGMGISSSLLDADSFKTVADYCDETVTLANGETEKRYQLDIVLDTLGEAIDALEEMLTTFGGFIYYYDGLIHLGVEKNENSSHTFTTANIATGSFSYQQVEKNDIPNIIRLAYTEPAEDYGQVYVQVESEIDRAENGDRVAELRMFGITRKSQATRRSNWILWKGLLAEYTCRFRVSIKHSHVTAGDVCTVTHAVAGWSGKKFRVIEVLEYSNDELQLTCEEYIEVTSALEEDLPETSYYTRIGGENTLLASAVPDAPTWTLTPIQGGWQITITSYTAGSLKYELCKYNQPRDSWLPYATFSETRNSSGEGALISNVYAADPSVETYSRFKLRVITATDQSELSAEQADWSKPDPSTVDSPESTFAPTLPSEGGTYPILTAKGVSGGDYKFDVELKIIPPVGYEDYIDRIEIERRDNGSGSYGAWENVGTKSITIRPATHILSWKNSDAIFVPGVTYQWRVQCVAVAPGGHIFYSNWSDSLTKEITDDITPPDKPTLIVVQHPLGLLLEISTPAESGGECKDFSHFKIEGNKGAGWVELEGHHSTTFYLHNLANSAMSETWQYRVTAYDRAGNASTVSDASAGKSPELLGSSCFQADCISTSHVDFTVIGTGNIVATVNASSEGLTISSDVLNITGDMLHITSDTVFDSNVEIQGILKSTGGIKTSASGDNRIEIGTWDGKEQIRMFSGGSETVNFWTDSGLAYFTINDGTWATDMRGDMFRLRSGANTRCVLNVHPASLEGQLVLYNNSNNMHFWVEKDFVNTTAVYQIDGTTVLSGQMSHVADPSGGTTVDTECRAQLAALIDEIKGVDLMEADP